MALGWIEGVIQGAQQDKGIQTNAWFMNENQKWSEFMAQHGNQFLVNDLKAAGLNPMLAFGKNVPMAGPQGGPPGHSAVSMSGLLLDSQRRKLDAETKNVAASTALQAAETKKIIDSLPALIRSLQGEAVRKEFGKTTIERGEKNMSDFWKFLEDLGSTLGGSAYNLKESVGTYFERFKEDVKSGKYKTKE